MWGRVLETRRRGLMKWRRYRDETGAIHFTYEVPAEVIGELGIKALAEALERAERKADRLRRNARALELLKQGWKPLAVGDELGLSESQVRRIRQQHRRKHKV